VLPNLSFHVVGISHHTVRVGERERFALSRDEINDLLNQLQQIGQSGLLLSTCNRCEYYWSGSHDGRGWLRSLAQARGASADVGFTYHEGDPAVRHLFTVAAGLDSQVIGETEILGQVRRAFDAARVAGTTTRDMDLIFSAALAAGRRVRRETVLGRHPSSVSSAAVDLVGQRWNGFDGREVVVLGAGEAAEGILRVLHQRKATNVSLLNRDPERARVLGQAWGASVGPLSDLDQRLVTADLLVVATAAAQPVLTAAQLAAATAGRDRELVVVDLGVPRNVEPAARSTAAVHLFDLDDLQRLCCPADANASAALAEAEKVIDEELGRLGMTLRGRAEAPRLAELHRIGVELAEQESAWALAQLDSLSETQQEIVRQMADRLVRRVLYPVSRKLRSD
jgi:glutamyl-tRNA reductase